MQKSRRLSGILTGSLLAFSLSLGGNAIAAEPDDASFINPRQKQIIPRAYRPTDLPDSLSPEARERIRLHIAEARAAKLQAAPAERKIAPLLDVEPEPAARATILAAEPARHPMLSYTSDGAVRLEIRFHGDVNEAVRDSLPRSLRVTRMNPDRNRIFANVMPENLRQTLDALANRNDVARIRPVIGGITRVGSQLTEGDAAHRADKARNIFHVNGSGVRLCAISDGIQNAAFSVATGDLPDDGTGQPDVDLCPLNDNAGDEGTAMLEIMHDVAPGASLGFCPAFGDNAAQGLADAVTWLANDAFGGQGCDIIVDDVAYLTEPYFQDGVVAQAVDAAADNGVAYFSSAGNGAEDHYELPYTDTVDGDDGSFPLDVHDFGLAGGAASDIDWNGVVGGAGNFFAVFLQWNDAFGASGNDYDVYLFDQNGFPAGSPGGDFPLGANGIDFQGGTGDPLEIAFVVNEHGTVTPGTPFGTILPFFIVVDRFDGDPDKLLEMNFNGLFAVNPDYNVSEGSVWGHSAARGAMAVAATGAVENIDGTPNPQLDIIEPFSSRGPSRVFFTANGNPVPVFFQERRKPDITATDGVSVTGVNFTSPFYGTSASAPHAAAFAALMLDADPYLNPHELDVLLKLTARDRGAHGFDTTWGYGFIDTFRAVTLARVTALLRHHRPWWQHY